MGLSVTACGKSSSESSDGTALEETNISDITEISDEEKELLTKTYTTSTEKERIAENNLYDYMKETVGEMREIYTYLNEKYPSYEFKIQSINLPTALNTTYTQYNVTNTTINPTASTSTSASSDTSASTSDELTALHQTYVISDEQGDYTDNCYKEIFETEYDNTLKELLTSNNIEIAQLYTDFTSNEGEDTTESTTINELNTRKVARTTMIYLPKSKSKTIISDIEKVIRDSDNYGSYIIYQSKKFKSTMTADECYTTYLDNSDKIDSYSFTTIENGDDTESWDESKAFEEE
jgi:hypothetical protein